MTRRSTICLAILWLFFLPVAGGSAPKGGEALVPVVAVLDHPGGQFTGYLMGGWSPRGWLKDKAAAPLLRGGETYRFYNLSGEVGSGGGSRPAPLDEDGPCTETLGVSFSDPPQVKGDLVAVGGPGQALPRRPRVLSTDQQVYRDAAAAILRQKGISSPVVRLTQVIRVDLEGDGEEEVLVTATHYAKGLGPRAVPGDYSLVFLRQVVQGKVVTHIVAGDFFPKGVKFGAPGAHKVGAILDLNGDGVMEIVLCGRYYEGDWATAYQLRKGKVSEILTSGCGV
jgi:hypothetical protein